MCCDTACSWREYISPAAVGRLLVIVSSIVFRGSTATGGCFPAVGNQHKVYLAVLLLWLLVALTAVGVQLVARLTAVRGALQDHLEDNPVIFSGIAALLDFVDQICRKLKATVLGAGSGPLQELLVQVRACITMAVQRM
jgi:hypothetical protein